MNSAGTHRTARRPTRTGDADPARARGVACRPREVPAATGSPATSPARLARRGARAERRDRSGEETAWRRKRYAVSSPDAYSIARYGSARRVRRPRGSPVPSCASPRARRRARNLQARAAQRHHRRSRCARWTGDPRRGRQGSHRSHGGAPSRGQRLPRARACRGVRRQWIWQAHGQHAGDRTRRDLGEVATAALPDTILAWYRRLVARKFDGSQKRRTPGRPRINREVEELIVRMAEENRSWGYDRIVGALANLGHEVSDQ